METKVIQLDRDGTLDVEGCLVLFPKYMAKLVGLGKELYVTGDKIGDRKACKLIVECTLEANSAENCDLLFYRIEKKQWTAVNVSEGVKLKLTRKGYDTYLYYTELRNIDKYSVNANGLINALSNYVRIYSSASIRVV